MDIDRTEEFSPLKNSEADPKDNPVTCRKHLSELHRSWLVKAGATLVGNPGKGSHVFRKFINF